VIDEQHRLELSSVQEKCDSTTRFGNDCHSYSADTRNEFVTLTSLLSMKNSNGRFDSNRLKVWIRDEIKIYIAIYRNLKMDFKDLMDRFHATFHYRIIPFLFYTER
jgi:hypothetical protein